MDQETGGPSRCPHLDRAISLAQAARFVLGLRNGETVAAAATAAGVAATTFYYRRRIDPAFAAVWKRARAGASDEAAAARAAERAREDAAAGTAVRRHKERRLVRKRKPVAEFDRDRKQTFLDHFAATCNLEASAEAAGISESTVYRALKSDAAFREGFEDALQLGYLCMEAEALREQREAQQAYRADPSNTAEKARSFERTMQLLREYKRAAGGTVGQRPYRSRTRWSFDAAIDSIEQKLRAFGIEIPGLPPPDAEEEGSPDD